MNLEAQSKKDNMWAVFCLFIFIAPILPILNLPQLGLKIAGIGPGAFITYLFLIGLTLYKLRLSFTVQKVVFLLTMIVSLLLFKLAISGTFFHYAKHVQLYFLSIIFFYLAYVYVDDEQKRSQLVNVFIVSTLCLAIFGILHYHFFYKITLADITGYSHSQYMGIIDRVKMRYRETATLPHPVHYSHLLSFGIIFIVKCVKSRYKWLAVLVLFYAIVISGSRSSFFYMLFFLFMIQVKFKKKGISGIIVVGCFILAATYFAAVYKTFDITNLYKSGVSVRLPKIQIAFKYAFGSIHNFFIGIPLELRPSMAIAGWGEQSVNDNSFASILVEIGTVGIFICLLIIKTIWNRIKRLSKANLSQSDTDYISAVKWCAISFFIFGLTSSLHKNLFPTALMYIFLGSIFSKNLSSQLDYEVAT